MSSCADCVAKIQLYIDAELIEDERADFLAHVKECTACSQALDDAQDLATRIRSAREQTHAPHALREAVLQIMNNGRAASSVPGLQTPIKKKPIASMQIMALAAVILLLVGVALALRPYRKSRRDDALIQAAVLAHEGLAEKSLSMDVSSDSKVDVSNWFASRVEFPFRLADSGIAADQFSRYKLIGGRLMLLGNDKVALLAFSLRDQTVSMLVGPGSLGVASGGSVVHSDGITFHTQNEGSLHIVSWNNKGLRYVLTSTISMGNPSRCADCHQVNPGGAPSAALQESNKRFRNARFFHSGIVRNVDLVNTNDDVRAYGSK